MRFAAAFGIPPAPRRLSHGRTTSPVASGNGAIARQVTTNCQRGDRKFP